MPIEIVETEISIDENDNWWNKENQITNNGVIKFFKMHLHKDPIAQRYYIHLKHTHKEEKGYLKKVRGFPLLTENFLEEDTIKFELDNLARSNLNEMFYDPIKCCYWSLWYHIESKSFIPYKITSRILQILYPFFESYQETYYLSYKNFNIPIIEKQYKPEEFSIV